MERAGARHNFHAKDDASSVYSRTIETPKVPSPWQLPIQILPIRHDLPEINSLDHQIALARGTTIALETTRARLRLSKTASSSNLNELKDEKLIQLEQQEYENIFYRSCFDTFHQLVVMTIGSIQDLTLQYHFEPEVSPCGNAHLMQTIDNMRAALERSVAQETEAEQEWKRQWGISRVRVPTTDWL